MAEKARTEIKEQRNASSPHHGCGEQIPQKVPPFPLVFPHLPAFTRRKAARALSRSTAPRDLPMPDAERFEVVSGRNALLGTGGFAVVVKAIDRHRGHEVAIKTVNLPRDDATTRGRLLRETALLQGIQHAHVVKLYESFEQPDMLRLVLEVLHGCTLAKCLSRRGALLEAEACQLAWQMLQALVYMHGRGIIHRDLKPENIMSANAIPRNDPLPDDVTWKIFDFGFGRQVRKPREPSLRRRRLSQGSKHDGVALDDIAIASQLSPSCALGPTAVSMHGSLAMEPRGRRTFDELEIDPSTLPRRRVSNPEIRHPQGGHTLNEGHINASTLFPHRRLSNPGFVEPQGRRTLNENEIKASIPSRGRRFSNSSATSSTSFVSDESASREKSSAMSDISVSSTLSIGGTRGYMAPELDRMLRDSKQLAGQPLPLANLGMTVSPALDMFALGVTLNYSCTGINPHLPTCFDTRMAQLVSGFRYRVRSQRKLCAAAQRLLTSLKLGAELRATAPQAEAMVKEWRGELMRSGAQASRRFSSSGPPPDVPHTDPEACVLTSVVRISR